MKKYIILLGLATMSCGPAYHLRRADHHLTKAKELGALVDTITHIRHDTITVTRIKDSLVFEKVVDYKIIDSLCGMWLEDIKLNSESVYKPKASTKVQKKKTPEKIDLLKEFQSNLCPDIDIDSTYHMYIKYQGKEIDIPIRIIIAGQPGKLSFKVRSTFKEDRINVKENQTIKIKAGISTMNIIGLLIIAAIVGFALSFLVPINRG